MTELLIQRTEEDVPDRNKEKKKLARAIELLAHANTPVFLLGSQVTLFPPRIPEILAAIDQLHVPVFLSGMARGLLPPGHALLFRYKRSIALDQADLVFLFGVPLDFRLNYGREINRKAIQVAINLNTEDMVQNRKPDLKIQGDPATFLIELGKFTHFQDNQCPWDAWKVKLHEIEREQEHFCLISHPKPRTTLIHSIFVMRSMPCSVKTAL